MTKNIDTYEPMNLSKILVLEDIITIHYFEYDKDYYFPGEQHNFWECLYVDKGSVMVGANHNTYTLNQGDIIFHEPLEFHTVESNGQDAPNLVVISFVCKSPAMEDFKEKRFFLPKALKENLRHLLIEAKETFETPLSDPYIQAYKKRKQLPFGSEQLILNYFENFLVECHRHISKVSVDTGISDQCLSEPDHQALDHIIGILKDHLYTSMDLQRLADLSHFSVSYMNALFRDQLNTSVKKYYQLLKIQEAKKLIRQTDLNFTQISQKLSFQSIHYFSRRFKQLTHMTLREYKASVKDL